MSGETLLTDLCAICHVNAIKYTCPRCGIHTCSLPCVKKHKSWAQCSGVRNPAEYRKRAELSTPSSVDKDFNFIAGVERSISKADDNVLGRGINLAPARQPRPHDARGKVDVEVAERGVKVVKAPKGLSRAKQNKTHWVNQQKSVMWTVEWVCPDGEKVAGSSLETRTLSEGYISTVGKKKLKRKRRDSQLEGTSGGPVAKVAKQESETDAGPELIVAEREGQSEPVKANDSKKDQPQAVSQDEQLLKGMHFYLHNPTTSSKLKCLMPMMSKQTIRETLEGQTVLEFPTIYVMHESPEQLQEPFITQAEYEKRYGSHVPINLTATLEDGEVDDHEDVAGAPLGVDPSKVLEVLAQDLT